MGAPHILHLPGDRIVRGYFPVPLAVGERVRVEGSSYKVEAAVTVTDDLLGQVVRARLAPSKGDDGAVEQNAHRR